MLASIDMAAYDSPSTPEPKVAVNFRAPKPLVDSLDDVMRLWKMNAAARGDEVEPIDRSYVIRRLLRLGVAAAFAEFLDEGDRPQSEADWDKIAKAIAKRQAAANKSR